MSQTLNPSSTVTADAGWSVVGSAGTHHASQADAVDGNYSQGATEGDVLELGVPNSNDPGKNNLHRVFIRKKRRGTGFAPIKLDLSLVCNTTVIHTEDITQTNSSVWEEWTFDLSAAEAANITDYDDLRIRMVDTQTGTANFHQITKTYILLDDAPAAIADFSGDTTSGDAPLTVNFTNLSDTATSDGLLTDWTYLWSFGAGEGTSTDTNPQHTYTTPGVYTVSLTVTAPGGNDTETKTGYILVGLVVGAGTAPDLTLAAPAVSLDVPVNLDTGTAPDLTFAAPNVSLDVPVNLGVGTAPDLTFAAPAVSLNVPVDIGVGTAPDLTFAAPNVSLNVPVNLGVGTAPDLLFAALNVSLNVGIQELKYGFAIDAYSLGPQALVAMGSWPGTGADF